MARFKQASAIDFAALRGQIRNDFTGLDRNDPSRWPALPRYLLLFALAVVVVVALWYAWLSGLSDELEAERQQEIELRQTYQTKLAQAVNLAALKLQLEQVQVYVNQIEKQLPSKAEMDALLSDINQAGLGRSLQFELFRPGGVNVQEYYAEQPIALRVTGSYHDIALFAADIAALSRIVTLNNLTIAPAAGQSAQPGQLTLDATAKTFRYLDPDEILSQKEARKASQQKGGKK
ncbi:type 4a pilus biogenesis protein PilO [Malikia sp.]|uniref:type 4a pilus biogenesis protein PilO n=1 Tax=Malikia sp. TaxID=2070706 RepID=UPI002617698C|nr:type 4a pilus biogenesis protein PilO [Malikia sp.]MDD2729212.1 type 4a pilus biogenesis protein PilO [Malikia sp.]